MLVAGPIVMAAGVPLSLLGNKAWREGCGPETSATVCARGTTGSMLAHIVTGLAYGGGMAIIGVGAGKRGAYNAQRDRLQGRAARDSSGWIIGGAIALPTGLIAAGMTRLFFWFPTPDCTTSQCVRSYQTYSTLAVATSAAVSGLGVGMLAYGIGYRRQAKRIAAMGVAPALGRSFTGVSLTGRF